jgi:hypothetical protein
MTTISNKEGRISFRVEPAKAVRIAALAADRSQSMSDFMRDGIDYLIAFCTPDEDGIVGFDVLKGKKK